MLSVIAVAMAGIAFVATRDQRADRARGHPRSRSARRRPTATPTTTPTPKPSRSSRSRAVQRGKVYVEVYNNSGITGLAGTVAERATGVGWQVVGSDNWYGTIPASTVYFPPRLKAAAELLGPRPRHRAGSSRRSAR